MFNVVIVGGGVVNVCLIVVNGEINKYGVCEFIMFMLVIIGLLIMMVIEMLGLVIMIDFDFIIWECGFVFISDLCG